MPPLLVAVFRQELLQVTSLFYNSGSRIRAKPSRLARIAFIVEICFALSLHGIPCRRWTMFITPDIDTSKTAQRDISTLHCPKFTSLNPCIIAHGAVFYCSPIDSHQATGRKRARAHIASQNCYSHLLALSNQSKRGKQQGKRIRAWTIRKKRGVLARDSLCHKKSSKP